MAGITYSRQDNHAVALALLQEAENVARKTGAPWETMISLATRAEMLGKTGRFEEAQQVFNQSLLIARESFLESWSTVSILLRLPTPFLGAAMPKVRRF